MNLPQEYQLMIGLSNWMLWAAYFFTFFTLYLIIIFLMCLVFFFKASVCLTAACCGYTLRGKQTWREPRGFRLPAGEHVRACLFPRQSGL